MGCFEKMRRGMEKWDCRRDSSTLMGVWQWAYKNASDEKKTQYSGFLKSKWTNEAPLAAVRSVFSKKARVGINGGLSKIGGPHIFSVSG
jgi:hypothetical protein